MTKPLIQDFHTNPADRTQRRSGRRSERRVSYLAMATVCSMLALGGCASTGSGTAAPEATAARAGTESQAPARTRQSDEELRAAALKALKTKDYVTAATCWSYLHDRHQDNAEIAVQYSSALRHIGSYDQAGTVMQRIQLLHKDNPAVLGEYGKVLVASGRVDQGVSMLQAAFGKSSRDWRLPSAIGVAYDQMGRYAEARGEYHKALELAPGEPSVLTNMGLSYALEGDLDKAEEVLRQAVANPNAGASARQNLAVVLGLQGHFEEARRLARADLPPNIAENNISYLKSMLSQPALWEKLKTLDGNGSNPRTGIPSS
ncbi:Flp pilus assembly protein TadD [Parvibaculum indicum]|uniref:tetratricopeptide repeat protein n=1 Tax=Parvibaculum indicum TaxID=562969 RepID=UPI001423597C|nr:tetratricopeptide repeat protein [Parvibaculum indicum]NIJ40778.1 Flp pilus assembly protein TadD [Parvibaculum indicum]